jgi:hypothetical protein
MKNPKLSYSTVGTIALLIAMAGFSSCVYLEEPSDTASAAREKSYQLILYEESSQQGKAVHGPSAATLQQRQIDQTSPLGGASNPNWGPLPLRIR